MVNQLKTNPIHIDTFAADVEFAPGGERFNASSIVFSSASAADTCVLVDSKGNTVYVSRIPVTNGVDEQHPLTSFDGLTLDVSQGTFVGPANLLIYSK